MTDELERRLREPLPDLPATLPALDLSGAPIRAGAVQRDGNGPTAGTRRFPVAIVIVGLVVAGILAAYGAWSSPRGVGVASSSHFVGATLAANGSPSAPGSPSASASASPSPSMPSAPPLPTASPSTVETTVTVPLGGTDAVVVTIEDQSGLLTGARPAVLALLPTHFRFPASYGDKNIASWNPDDQPSSVVWLYWGGVICDRTSRLVIVPGATSMTVTEGPYPACDAANDGRGLILTFAVPVDAARIVATFVDTAPTF